MSDHPVPAPRLVKNSVPVTPIAPPVNCLPEPSTPEFVVLEEVSDSKVTREENTEPVGNADSDSYFFQ